MRTPCRRSIAPTALVGMYVGAGVLLGARVASADDTVNAAAAQTLFDEAKALMQADNFAAACPKLAESQRLQAAGGTLMFLALCREGEKKTATAWTLFNQVLSAARRDGRHDREKVAQEHIASLTPRLMKLSIVVAEGVTRPPGLEIRDDDAVVPSELWGTAVPVDPGAHAVRATAPGMTPWDTSVTATEEGQTVTVSVPALAASPDAPAPPPVEATTPLVAPVSGPPVETAPASVGRKQRTVAIAVGGLGVVVLGAGATFGAIALADNGKTSSAVTDGNLSTAFLCIGAAGVVAGGLLWLTAPSRSARQAAWSAAPLLGSRYGGVGVARTW
jgi:hypothetical protein